MSPDRREILEQVARGELTPEAADELLQGDDEAPAAPQVAESPPSTIQRVKIAAGFGAIVVTGDPNVAEAEVEGNHSVLVDGDTLVIRSDVDANPPGSFSIHLGPRRRSAVRIGGRHASSLRVRMNPALALEAKLDAGPMSISGIEAPVRARSGAGPITVEDFGDTIDVAVNAGAVRVIGKLTSGESRIRSDAGAVRVELDPASSVRIFADAVIGKVVLPGVDESERRRFGSKRETTIGAGDATLRVETAMGSIHVTTAE